jgi:hypothetical protein
MESKSGGDKRRHRPLPLTWSADMRAHQRISPVCRTPSPSPLCDQPLAPPVRHPRLIPRTKPERARCSVP